ncbi:phospholipase A [Methyloversatilis sp. XJ19-49]|uniref:phospholipase A n=1 Tax=Methyloversatilis sp. XJ19-49 TaxID=2963429 RepID=UPI00211C5E09|nr:phospholipase A [Methyloversatilis sp. XJ19-49]MCQ9376647.1 phospholipase A [Methyloversatilis sp. XJ19-49]
MHSISRPPFSLARRTNGLLAGLLAALTTLPVQADLLLATRQTQIEPGLPLTLTVISTAGETLPDDLKARVIVGVRAADVALRASAPAEAGRREYAAVFPTDLEGTGRIELTSAASSVLLVQLKPAPLAAGAVAVTTPDAVRAANGDAATGEPVGVVNLGRNRLGLSTHEPVYFVAGSRGDTTARFQLSFKFRLFDPDGWATEIPVGELLTGLHFGYTQTSIWDWSSDSKPFRDTVYKPSFFYEFGPYRQIGSRHTFTAQAGYEHQSNGRDADESRSIDTLFVKPSWRWDLDHNTHVGASLKVFDYTDRDPTNRDISRYRGYALLGVEVGNDDGWLLKAESYPGSQGSMQVDLSYRLKRLLIADAGAGGFLHFQYFNGYGESLVDYNRSGPAQFRVGFSIVR